jgi:hypothetical protein
MVACPIDVTAADAAAADEAALASLMVQTLASAPAEVRVCGTCSAHPLCLGMFSRVVGRQCEGRALYQQGTADSFLSFFRRRWRIGCGDGVGTFGCWISVDDDAQYPNAIRASWQLFDKGALVALPTVSVMLEGRSHMERRVHHCVL